MRYNHLIVYRYDYNTGKSSEAAYYVEPDKIQVMENYTNFARFSTSQRFYAPPVMPTPVVSEHNRVRP